jgi:anaerobic ribonucleoside-triphosphate reductase activating protein
MRYAQIRDMDIVNGQGIAVSLFVQGCSHHCPCCFNQSTWDFKGGNEWTQEVEDKFIELCKKDYITCVSLLGGDPLDQDIRVILKLVKRIKLETNKPIYVWTGYTFKEVFDSMSVIILPYIDYIIDGRFEQDKRDLNLKLRGSSNQRIWHKVNSKTQEWKDITEQIDKNS